MVKKVVFWRTWKKSDNGATEKKKWPDYAVANRRLKELENSEGG